MISTRLPTGAECAAFVSALILFPGAGVGPVAAQATFSRTGDTTVQRDLATATLLSDGRVLVAGGVRTGGGNPAINTGGIPGGGSNALINNQAEIYDPNTGAFTATGSMATPRLYHAAAGLSDGRVLVLGGEIDAKSGTATAELFDPAKGTFSSTGNMTSNREEASATVLKDGRVLVVGGATRAGNLLSDNVLPAEIYDPKLGTFTPTGNITRTRQWHTAVSLADGRVLILGGRGIDDAIGIVALKDVEVFDPASGMFAKIGQLSEGRIYPSATLLPDGRVLVAGGIGIGDGPSSKTVEIFDPSKGTSTMAGTMSEGRIYHVAVGLADGRVLLAGGDTGFNASDSTASADLFDPKTGKIAPAAPLGEPREAAATVRLVDGRVLILGGARIAGGNLAARLQTAELFKP